MNDRNDEHEAGRQINMLTTVGPFVATHVTREQRVAHNVYRITTTMDFTGTLAMHLL